jgi:hypothetical protein
VQTANAVPAFFDKVLPQTDVEQATLSKIFKLLPQTDIEILPLESGSCCEKRHIKCGWNQHLLSFIQKIISRAIALHSSCLLPHLDGA